MHLPSESHSASAAALHSDGSESGAFCCTLAFHWYFWMSSLMRCSLSATQL